MEKVERVELSRESIKRKENVERLAFRAVEFKDPELCYCCILLHNEYLTSSLQTELINVIANSKDPKADEMAYRLLYDQPTLPQRFRDALLEHIVVSADQTTCAVTLTAIPHLGAWEAKLRHIVYPGN